MLKLRKNKNDSQVKENVPIKSMDKGKKKIIKIAVCIVLAVSVSLGAVALKKYNDKKSADSAAVSSTSIVRRGTVVSSITGSGTVEPIEQREIVPLINGKIAESPFDEGQSVSEGDILYKFEMTSAENAIKTAKNSVKSAQNNVEKAKNTLNNKSDNIAKVQENISKLTIYASASGKVSDLNLKQGDEASGAICKITNYKEQTATIPFNSGEISKISVGDLVTVEIDKYMMYAGGKVTRKYTSPTAGSDGSIVYNADILITDDITLPEGINVNATVHTSFGDVSSASYGEVSYADPVTVNAEQKGKVSSVNVKNGDWVNKGDVIAVLTNSDLTDSLKAARQEYTEAQMNLSDSNNSLMNAESGLEDKEEAAEDYVVKSPIDGVVLSKTYTKGDTVSGNNATTLMIVADLSKMKFTIDVDELDIAKIEIGQSVQVTADALEGENILGTITSLSKTGTASNGVTTYPIEVTIDDPGDLMPGMNVSAEIIVEQSEDTLYLPLTAVEHFGGKYYVTVVGEVEGMPSGTPGNRSFDGLREDRKENGEEKARSTESGDGIHVRPIEGGENSSKMRPSEKSEEGNVSSASDEKTDAKGAQKRGSGANRPSVKLSGEETRVEVEIGISNDDYYEIKSGVSEGQVVKNTTQVSSSNSSQNGFGSMGGMPSGMGGGMPSGMGGGMPSGRSGGMPGGR